MSDQLLTAAEISAVTCKLAGYVLVNTDRVVWQAGSFVIVGDEPHVYPTLAEAAEYRNMYAGDNANQKIHVFALVPVDSTALAKAYGEHPYEDGEEEPEPADEPQWQVVVYSAVYGYDTHGPYASVKLAQEAIERLEAKADELGDCVSREYSIETYVDDSVMQEER